MSLYYFKTDVMMQLLTVTNTKCNGSITLDINLITSKITVVTSQRCSVA